MENRLNNVDERLTIKDTDYVIMVDGETGDLYKITVANFKK